MKVDMPLKTKKCGMKVEMPLKTKKCGMKSLTVIIIGSGHRDPSSNPVCISCSTNTPGKSMNPTILPPVMGK